MVLSLIRQCSGASTGRGRAQISTLLLGYARMVRTQPLRKPSAAVGVSSQRQALENKRVIRLAILGIGLRHPLRLVLCLHARQHEARLGEDFQNLLLTVLAFHVAGAVCPARL